MLNEILLAMGASHEAEIHPHRLLHSNFADVHGKRIWQIRRPILPSRKRQPRVLNIGGAKTDAERRGAVFPTRPSLPKQRALCPWTLSLFGIAYPKQLDHGIREGKTAIGRTLTGMLTWGPFMQTEMNQVFRFGSAWIGTDEQVVQLNSHAT